MQVPVPALRTITVSPVDEHRTGTDRAFAAGDRAQSTAPDRARDLATRELGMVERIDAKGQMEIRWDSGRTSSFESGERRHLDHGYAVTSHSSQGLVRLLSERRRLAAPGRP